jgi:hypothetical protein
VSAVSVKVSTHSGLSKLQSCSPVLVGHSWLVAGSETWGLWVLVLVDGAGHELKAANSRPTMHVESAQVDEWLGGELLILSLNMTMTFTQTLTLQPPHPDPDPLLVNIEIVQQTWGKPLHISTTTPDLYIKSDSLLLTEHLVLYLTVQSVCLSVSFFAKAHGGREQTSAERP